LAFFGGFSQAVHDESVISAFTAITIFWVNEAEGPLDSSASFTISWPTALVSNAFRTASTRDPAKR
jgi:hypothetical protein